MTPSDLTTSRLDSIADPRTLLVGLFEHSPVAFQVYRADGHSLLVNQAFRELFQSEPPPEYNILLDPLAAGTARPLSFDVPSPAKPSACRRSGTTRERRRSSTSGRAAVSQSS